MVGARILPRLNIYLAGGGAGRPPGNPLTARLKACAESAALRKFSRGTSIFVGDSSPSSWILLAFPARLEAWLLFVVGPSQPVEPSLADARCPPNPLLHSSRMLDYSRGPVAYLYAHQQERHNGPRPPFEQCPTVAKLRRRLDRLHCYIFYT